MSDKKLKLFRVLSAGGKVEGEFGSKMAAKRHRDHLNAGKPAPWAWVSPGPDHWRWNTDRRVPYRPRELVWIKGKDGEPHLHRVLPSELWVSEEPVEAQEAA